MAKPKVQTTAITANGTEVNEDELLYKMDAAELAGVNEGYLLVLAKKNPTLAGGVVKDTYPGSSHARWRISRAAIEQWKIEQQSASSTSRPRGGSRRMATIEVLTPDQIVNLQAYMTANGMGQLGPIYKARTTASKRTNESASEQGEQTAYDLNSSGYDLDSGSNGVEHEPTYEGEPVNV
jgi:hypothetical protein